MDLDERTGTARTADGGAAGSDPYPGEGAQAVEDWNQGEPLHQDDSYEPDEGPTQFQFVWANGQLHVSPAHSHDELLRHTGADMAGDGPTAVGYADVANGHVTWRVESNVGLQGLRDVLAHYSRQVGWKFDGLVGTDGQPMGLDLGPIMSFWYREKDHNVEIAEVPFKGAKEIYVSGSTAWVDKEHPGLVDWAGDLGVRLAEYPQSTMNWQPGTWGKGIILDGELHTWPTDAYAGDGVNGEPHHGEFLRQRGLNIWQPPQPPRWSDPIVINPNGYYVHNAPRATEKTPDVTRFAQAHPVLKYDPRERRIWSKTAEYPGGGQMFDHMKHHEDMEQFNNADPNFQPERQNLDEDPGGPFVCPQCGSKPASFGEYKLHMDEHQPKQDVIEDGHFPQIQDSDEPLGFGTHPQANPGLVASVKPFVMVLPNQREAKRIPEFEMYADLFDFRDTDRYYGAYRDGELVGYGVVREPSKDLWYAATDIPEIRMIQVAEHHQGVGTAILRHIQTHYDHLYSHADTDGGAALMRRCGMVNTKGQLWRYSAGSDPKDMIEADVPFVYDIPNDKLHIGYPGQSTHDVGQGQLTPGGLVEGYFQPGGKVVIQTASTWPMSVRHLIDLWYYTAPQMEVTSVEEIDANGETQKLAADQGQNVGAYLKTLLQSDVAAQAAYDALRTAGGKVYAVGGAPRDALMGRIPNDIDLLVSGLPQEQVEHILKQQARKTGGNVTFAGKNFGVFHYHQGSDTVEIALPRSDDYGEGGRRGEGNITVDHDLPISDDLGRRDFTANSIATDLDSGETIDPYNGADDIKRGVLRTTHPNAFREDPSRLIRALTMHGRFHLSPDEQTRHEMEAHGHLLRGESPDLLNKTFTKTMASDNPAAAIRLAHDTGLLQHLIPEVHENWDFDQNNPHHNYTLGEHTLGVLDNVSRLTSDPDVRLAALLHDMGKPDSQWTDPQTGESHFYLGSEGQGANHDELGAKMAGERLQNTFNLQRTRINRIQHIVKNHMFAPFTTPKGARRFIARVGDEHVDDLLNLREADQTGKGQSPDELAARTSADQMRDLVNQARVAGDATHPSAMSVNGNDLIAMGMKPGPAIGATITQLMNHVLENPMDNQRDKLMQVAQGLVTQQQEQQ